MSWHLFDRIRSLTHAANIYQQERLFQDQSSLDRISAGSDLLDFNQQQALLDQTNLQINRLERYKDYDQMDETGEMSLALDLYGDEASLVDSERKHTLIIKAKTNVVKKELESLFFSQLLIDNTIRAMVRYVCKYGDSPYEIVPTVNRDGVAAIKFMNVYNFTRVETKHGDLVGFFYQDEVMEEPTFLHPWQVMHLRLTDYGNIYHPYGRSIMEGGRKAFKQLRLMEDAALIYRITRAPEKRVFKIPIGNIPAKDVPEFMQSIARMFKNQRFYDPRTGQFNERWSPLIQEDDFFLPVRPDGTSPSIETLKGAENLDQIADIEYFKKKMVAPTKIPFKRVGIGEGAGDEQEKSLASSDAQFAKAVQWVQREVAMGLTKVAICHLAMAGFSTEDLKSFEIGLSASSAIDELYRIETWQGRTSVMGDLKDLGWFPKEWIVTRFTDLSPDEIKELTEIMSKAGDLDNEMDGGMGGMGGLGGGSPPPSGKSPGDLPDLEGSDDAGLEGLAGGAADGPAGAGGPAGAAGAAAGGAPAGGAPAGAAGAAGAGALSKGGLGERLDRRYGKIITEVKKLKYQTAINEFVTKVDVRLNSPKDSPYLYFLGNNEIDGLRRGIESELIIESVISRDVRKKAAKEFYDLLKKS